MASSVQGSEEYVGNACCVCLKKNRRKDADKFCIQCADYFCSSCEDNVHAMLPANTGHRLLGKSDFKSLLGSKKETLPRLPTQRCGQHHSKVLEFYCADHDEVVCSSCVALEHRSCQEVKSVSEDIKNLYSKVNIGDTKKWFSSVMKSLEDTLGGQNEDVKKLKNSYEKVRREVEAFYKELHKNLVAAKQETLNQLQDDYKREEAKITEKISESKYLLQSMKKLMLELEKMEGNQAQEFVQIKTFEKLVAKREELQKKQQKQSSSIIVSFTADSDIKAYFQQIKVLGLVTTGTVSKTLLSEEKPPEHREEVRRDLSPEPVEETFASKAKPSESKAGFVTPKTSLYKVIETIDINVRLPDDEYECRIFGSCLTEEGCLLLADDKNSKLKRLDLSTQKVRDYLILKAGPWAVCSVSYKEVAVSLYNSTVQIVSVADKLTCTRTLTFDHDCMGIAHHNGRLYISDNKKSVYIHDMKGDVRKITHASRRYIFQQTRHIAVSAAGERVYVADAEKGLITLDIDGNYLCTTSREDMQARGAWGVCTDGRNVFVCGYLSGNVVQIGQDNTPLGQIAKLDAPVSLCFDSQTNTLYITRCGDQVRVLQLK